MQLVEFAEQYVQQQGLQRTPVYSANRFAKMIGNLRIDEITDAHLADFRRKCEECGKAPWTIKGGLKDLRTLIRASGLNVRIPRIKTPEPDPQPVPLDHIDAIWEHCAEWSRQWIVLAFWTGLRCADSIRLQKHVVATADTLTQRPKLEWVASKTGHRQQWPVPAWLRPWLTHMQLPFANCTHHNAVILRAELERCRKLAGLKNTTIQPSGIRDASLTEWCRADFHVGQVVHGCRLGVIGCYVDSLDVIAPVAPRVRLPECFGATAAADDLTCVIDRLDPDARRIVSEMAVRLAR